MTAKLRATADNLREKHLINRAYCPLPWLPPATDRSLMLKRPHTLNIGLRRTDLEASSLRTGSHSTRGDVRATKGEQQSGVLPSCEACEPQEQQTR